MTNYKIRQKLKRLDLDEYEIEEQIDFLADENRRDQAEKEYLEKIEREEKFE